MKDLLEVLKTALEAWKRPGFSSESDLAVGEVPDPAPVVEPAPARESKAAPAKAVESKAVPPTLRQNHLRSSKTFVFDPPLAFSGHFVDAFC